MYGCYTSIDLCAIRGSVLNPDGTRIGNNPNGSAYNLSARSLGRSPNVDAGESTTERDGCGDICFSRSDPDVTVSETLTLELCQLDVELISLFTGGEVLLDGVGEVIGVEAPDPTLTPPVIEFHGWTKAFSGPSQVASPRSYWHWVWPFVQWTISDWTIERGLLAVQLSGTAQGNANVGSGSFGDLPGAGVQQFFGVFLADDIPNANVAPYNAAGLTCGFVDTPALLS